MIRLIRALVDANVLISYLLARSVGPPAGIIAAARRGDFSLLVAETTFGECARRINEKPWLAQRIAKPDWDEFAVALRSIAAAVPNVPPPFPAIGRDPKDDYLIVHAIAARADYLITGDKDLLVLGRIEGVTILAPAAFLALLPDGAP